MKTINVCQKTVTGKLQERYMRQVDCCVECHDGDYVLEKKMVWCHRYRAWHHPSERPDCAGYIWLVSLK